MSQTSRSILRVGSRRWAAALTIAGLAGGACDDKRPTAPVDPIQAELNAVTAATSRYQDVSVALQDGFLASPICVTRPEGTMGIHYFNRARIFDGGRLSASEPEMLLYLPENGRLRLVAVEYVLPILENGQPYVSGVPPANPPATPVLFGQPFQGPMPGHAPAEPWHFDLHVWIWAHNPSGMFAPVNPTLACPSS